MKLEPFKYDELSNHIVSERLDRFVFMLTRIGYNGIVRSVADEMNPAHTQHITDTGLLFITGTTKQGKVIVVTGFPLTIDKLTAIYKGVRLPQELYNAVLRNMESYPELYKMKKQGGANPP